MNDNKGHWVICEICRGDGTVVNPNIDDNGLTREDFIDDPDFAEAYITGVYDITCNICYGTGKVQESEMKAFWNRHREQAEGRRTAARENGDFDTYSGAGDPRWSR